MTFLDVQVVLLDHLMEFLPYSKVVAVGCGISGKLMATSGMLTPDTSGSEDSEDLMLSTYKISEAWEGGPLFDVEGNFVGMNLFFVKERTLFLPTSIIFGRLVQFQMSLRTSKFLAQLETYKAGSCIKFSEGTLFSNKSKRTDDWKKNKRACNGGGKTSNSLISGVLKSQRGSILASRLQGLPKDTNECVKW